MVSQKDTIRYDVYIVRCADGSLYTGVTTDLERRIAEHNGDAPGGAKYTSARRPVTLVYSELHPSKSAAMKREYEIKQLSHGEKDALTTSGSGRVHATLKDQ